MKIALRTFTLLLLLNLGTVFGFTESFVEVRGALFFPSSSLFKEIYGNTGGCIQLEADTSFCGGWGIWSNLDWLSKKGKSVGFKDPTRVSLSTIGLGVKYSYDFFSCYSLYLGVGPTLGTIWLKNKPFHHTEKVCKTTVGALVKTGVLYNLNERFFLDVFVDYLYQPMHFEKHVNVGGFKTGAGIGYKL